MGRTLIIAEINGEDVRDLNATLDILDEPICMNLGVAFMPFMDEGFYFIKEDNNLKSENKYGINDVETGFVEYLYKIRQANRTKTKIEYTRLSGPNTLTRRERIFLAGKIFPVMCISYSGNDIDCSTSKIQIKSVSTDKLRYRLHLETLGYEEFSKNNYISIDNDNIRIYLPKYSSVMKIDYAKVLVDFLTNGEETKIAVVNGEFPNMEIYTMATGNINLQKACWLKKDREERNKVWKNACMYIVEHKYQGVLGPFGQIADFYNLLKQKINKTKHKTRWLLGASKLVKALKIMDGGFMFVDNDVEVILSELNIGICDYAITQFYELFYGKYKDAPLDTMEKAYDWDLAFVKYEQGVVAVPIYTKTSKETIKKFQAMVDKDPQGDIRHGTGGFFGVAPEFDAWDGSVTDTGFRVDLPMLMLWLDRHKPTSAPFKGKIETSGNLKGCLKEEYKKIIRPYAVE
jgi:hypothetical protein